MTEILEILKSLALLAIIVGITVGIAMLVKYIRTKVNGTKYEEAVGIILDSVDMVNQTFVKSLKEAGVFDEEANSKALQLAIDNALKIMNDDLKSYITTNYGDATAWMESIIESKIYNDNKENDKSQSGTVDTSSSDSVTSDTTSDSNSDDTPQIG